MTRTVVSNPRVAEKDRHLSRKGPWNAKPMKKSGGGKGNWGTEGVEVEDFYIPVGEEFDDTLFKDHKQRRQPDNNKIKVVSKSEMRRLAK